MMGGGVTSTSAGRPWALVTGAAGFVGRHMGAELRDRGFVTVECDITPWADRRVPGPGVDCLNLFRAEKMVFDLVVHAAARAPHRAAIDGQPAASVYNRLLDAAMFEWALRTGQRRVLYLSSSAVYPDHPRHGPFHELDSLGNEADPVEAESDAWNGRVPWPPDAYGWTKLAGEQMAAAASAAGLLVHVVRPFSGYGEDQTEDFPFGAFVARAKRREDPFRIWGNGLQVRDWIHIDDVVRGALAVVDADVREPVNLCTGVGTSLAYLAEMVTCEAGYAPEFEFDLRAPAGVAYRVGDSSRMRDIYTPRVSLAEGITRALESTQV